MNAGHHDRQRLVLASAAASGFGAFVKLVAALASGSLTLLAETLHSLSDVAEQVALSRGLGFDRARESRFFPLVGAQMMYFGGGAVAILTGIDGLSARHGPAGSQLLPLVALLVAFAVESGTHWLALRELTGGDRRPLDALFSADDPRLRILLLRATGALLGLILALLSVLTTWISGSRVADGIGSIVIGVVLGAIGVSVAHDTRRLVLGEPAPIELRERVVEIARETDGVDDVTELYAHVVGESTVAVVAEVRGRPGLTDESAGRMCDLIASRVREEIPEVARIFVVVNDR